MANKIKCPKCGEEIDIEDIILSGSKEVVDKDFKKHWLFSFGRNDSFITNFILLYKSRCFRRNDLCNIYL